MPQTSTSLTAAERLAARICRLANAQDTSDAEDRYDAAKHCQPSAKGDCIVAALDRLQLALRCAPTDDQKREALRFAVHFVGDIH